MNKKKKRRKRKPRIRKSAVVNIETPRQQRNNFPDKLLSSYLALSKSNWADKEYRKYIRQAKKYLGDKFDDPIECCRLIVLLYKATTDLRDVEEEKEK